MATTSLTPASSDHSQTRILLRSAQDGDEEAWARLFDEHRGYLVYCVRAARPDRSKRRFDPEDVVQTGMMRAWQRIDNFEYRGEGPLRFWLRKIVLNALLDHLRVVDARPASGVTTMAKMPDGAGTPDDTVADRELSERFFEALAEIGEEGRELVIMRKLEKLPWPRIEALTEVPETTCRRRYVRALNVLQSRMG